MGAQELQRNEVTLIDDVESLIDRVRTAHREAQEQADKAKEYASKAIDRAYAAGDLLLLLKPSVKHGEWESFLAERLPEISIRQAQKYMRIARELPLEKRTGALLTVNGALRMLEESNEEPANEPAANDSTDVDIKSSQIRKDVDAFIAEKELHNLCNYTIRDEPVKEATRSTEPDYDDSAYVKKAQDDAWLDSFYKFSESAACFCNEKNADYMKRMLIEHSEYYRDRWRRSVKDSVSNVMTFLDNKHFYMKALDEALFEIVPHYEKRETTTDSEELIKLRKEVIKLQSELFNEKLKTSSFRNDEQLQVELEKAQRSCKFWKTKIKDKEQRTAYEKQEQYWREPKEVKFGDPEFLERFEKMREEQINIAAKTYGLQKPMPIEVWRRLIQLSHPDKHGGSEASNEATEWLIKNRPVEACLSE